MTKVLVLNDGVEYIFKTAWEDWEEQYGTAVLISDDLLNEWEFTVKLYNEFQESLAKVLHG